MLTLIQKDAPQRDYGHFCARPVNLGLIQMSTVPEVDRNIERALNMVREAANHGAQIICLPELFSTPYFPQFESTETEYREPFEGRVYQALSAVARETKTVLVGGSFYQENGAEKGFNTSLVFGIGGELLSFYQKMHIPHDPGFFEGNYFDVGEAGYRVIDTPWCKIAVGLCYDQWFPEPARVNALAGAEILLYPTAIGHVDGIDCIEGDWPVAWNLTHRALALQNNVVVAAVNRVGKEFATTFWGESLVIDGFGREVAKAGSGEEILLSKVNLAHSSLIVEAWRFRDSRRPETYGAITEPKE